MSLGYFAMDRRSSAKSTCLLVLPALAIKSMSMPLQSATIPSDKQLSSFVFLDAALAIATRLVLVVFLPMRRSIFLRSSTRLLLSVSSDVSTPQL